jgi:hypothetical protein
LHSIGAKCDTVLNLGCGYGKNLVMVIAVLLLRNELKLPKGFGLCLVPTNCLSEEKLANAQCKTAYITHTGEVKYSAGIDKPSSDIDFINSGEIVLVICSAEALTTVLGGQVLKSDLVLGCVDESNLFKGRL